MLMFPIVAGQDILFVKPWGESVSAQPCIEGTDLSFITGRVAQKDPRVHAIRLFVSYGHQIAYSTSGDCAVSAPVAAGLPDRRSRLHGVGIVAEVGNSRHCHCGNTFDRRLRSV